jgi:hypothetical protein
VEAAADVVKRNLTDLIEAFAAHPHEVQGRTPSK